MIDSICVVGCTIWVRIKMFHELRDAAIKPLPVGDELAIQPIPPCDTLQSLHNGLAEAIAHDGCRIPRDHGERRNIFSHDRSRANDSPVSHRDSSEDYGGRADPDIMPDGRI